MKKLLFIAPALLLILSGCSWQASDQVQPLTLDTNQTAPSQTNASSAPSAAATTTTMDQTTIDQSKFTDLTKEYSQAIIKTNFGDVTVKFYADAPKTVNNFLNLAKLNFYNNTKFHRVIKGFMIQGGDPNSKDSDWSNDGQGGPGYQFADEPTTHKLVKGSLAMANAGPNTNGSQFFIVTAAATAWLDGSYNNFGEVTSGMDVVTKIENLPTNQNDHPTQDATVNSIELVK